MITLVTSVSCGEAPDILDTKGISDTQKRQTKINFLLQTWRIPFTNIVNIGDTEFWTVYKKKN